MEEELNSKSKEIRWGIVISRKHYNESFENIAQRYNLSHKSVASRIYKLYEETGKVSTKKSSGRPKIKDEVKERIVEIVKAKSTRKSLRDIEKKLYSEEINICHTSVGNILKSEGYKYGPVRYVPELTAFHKLSRYNYAIENYESDFQNVVFVDEVWFELWEKKAYIWYKEDSDRTYKDFHSLSWGNSKLMISAAVSARGKSSIHYYKGTVNKETYTDFLRDSVIPQFNKIYGERRWKLVHDQARPHTAKYTKDYLSANLIEIMSHPSRSPDYNIIELCWNIMKRKIAKLEIRDLGTLVGVIEEAWDEVNGNLVDKLIENLKLRFDEVIAADGDFP